MKLPLCSIIAVLSLTSAIDARIWTDKNGRTVEAELVEVKGESIMLDRGGRRFSFLLNNLTDKDQEYIAKWMAGRTVTKGEKESEKTEKPTNKSQAEASSENPNPKKVETLLEFPEGVTTTGLDWNPNLLINNDEYFFGLAEQDGKAFCYRIKLDGSDFKKLHDVPHAESAQLLLGPDWKLYVCSSTKHGKGGWEIVRMNPDGSEKHTCLEPGEHITKDNFLDSLVPGTLLFNSTGKLMGVSTEPRKDYRILEFMMDDGKVTEVKAVFSQALSKGKVELGNPDQSPEVLWCDTGRDLYLSQGKQKICMVSYNMKRGGTFINFTKNKKNEANAVHLLRRIIPASDGWNYGVISMVTDGVDGVAVIRISEKTRKMEAVKSLKKGVVPHLIDTAEDGIYLDVGKLVFPVSSEKDDADLAIHVPARDLPFIAGPDGNLYGVTDRKFLRINLKPIAKPEPLAKLDTEPDEKPMKEAPAAPEPEKKDEPVAEAEAVSLPAPTPFDVPEETVTRVIDGEFLKEKSNNYGVTWKYAMSNDRRHFAVSHRKGSRFILEVDGKEVGTYDEVPTIGFSGDSSKLYAHVVKSRKHMFLTVENGEVNEGPDLGEYEIRNSDPETRSIHRSRWGDGVFSIVQLASKDRRTQKFTHHAALVNGKKGPVGKKGGGVGEIIFSEQGNRFAYLQSLNGTSRLVLDGEIAAMPEESYVVSILGFHDDGKTFAHVEKRDMGSVVVENGKSGPKFNRGIISYARRNGHSGYVGIARKGGAPQKHHVVHDGKIIASYDWAGGVTLSPDGTKLAYSAGMKNERDKIQMSVYLDGKEQGLLYDAIETIQFSEDGKSLSYVGRKGHGYDHFAVVDGTEVAFKRGQPVSWGHAFLSSGGKFPVIPQSASPIAFDKKQTLGARPPSYPAEQVMELAAARQGPIALSADNQSFAFVSTAGGRWQVAIGHKDGLRLVPVASPLPSQVSYISLSPDGNSVAFVGRIGEKRAVYVNGVPGMAFEAEHRRNPNINKETATLRSGDDVMVEGWKQRQNFDDLWRNEFISFFLESWHGLKPWSGNHLTASSSSGKLNGTSPSTTARPSGPDYYAPFAFGDDGTISYICLKDKNFHQVTRKLGEGFSKLELIKATGPAMEEEAEEEKKPKAPVIELTEEQMKKLEYPMMSLLNGRETFHASLAPDGKRLALAIMAGSREQLVVDNKVIETYEVINWMEFSPSSKVLHASVREGRINRIIRVADGKVHYYPDPKDGLIKTPPLRSIGNPAFHYLGKSDAIVYAVNAPKDTYPAKDYLVVDGVAGPKGSVPDISSSYSWKPFKASYDGKRHAYPIYITPDQYVVRDGKLLPESKVSKSNTVKRQLVMNSTGSTVAYITKADRGGCVVINGKRGKTFYTIGAPQIRGSSVAYVASELSTSRDKTPKNSVVFNDKTMGTYSWVGEVVISSDGKRIAYVAGEWRGYANKKPKVCAVYTDGEAGWDYDFCHSLSLYSTGSSNYIGVKNGKEFKIKDGKEVTK